MIQFVVYHKLNCYVKFCLFLGFLGELDRFSYETVNVDYAGYTRSAKIAKSFKLKIVQRSVVQCVYSRYFL